MNTNTLEINKMLTLSTCHISKKTSLLLNTSHDLQHGLSVYEKFIYGWFVYIKDADFDLLPPDLQTCICFAKTNDCTIIYFEAEGPVMPELKKFIWE